MNIPNPHPKLEERLRGVLRLKQYSKRTEERHKRRGSFPLPARVFGSWLSVLAVLLAALTCPRPDSDAAGCQPH